MPYCQIGNKINKSDHYCDVPAFVYNMTVYKYILSEKFQKVAQCQRLTSQEEPCCQATIKQLREEEAALLTVSGLAWESKLLSDCESAGSFAGQQQVNELPEMRLEQSCWLKTTRCQFIKRDQKLEVDQQNLQ